jgi:hypothetical protein
VKKDEQEFDESKDLVEQVFDAEFEEPVTLENFMKAIPKDRRSEFVRELVRREAAEMKAERETSQK